MWLQIVLFFSFVVVSKASETGLASCPCLDWPTSDTHPSYVAKRADGTKYLRYEPVGQSGTSYQYPLGYGKGCKAHDAALPPSCTSNVDRPAWCGDKWCYVDNENCDTSMTRSSFFPNERNLYYSYRTCGNANSFSAGTATDIVPLIQGYLVASRTEIEAAWVDLQADGNWNGCSFNPLCNCETCKYDVNWKQEIDLSLIGSWQRPSTLEDFIICLSQGISQSFLKVAAKEAVLSTDRIGFQYFADQQTGSYVQWPNTEWCPADYDPRYRPWYAAGSTGPKDVVIVVDISGSMATNNRNLLAKKAVKAILDTLTWKDFVSIVQFDSQVQKVFSSTLLSVSNMQRDLMKQWIDEGDGADGGTNFQAALLGTDEDLPGAFKVIERSVKEGKTSMCQKVIMFLTDGNADFQPSDYSKVQQLSTRYDVSIFTYALGSGADTTVTKRLACENRGIFYMVRDGADLSRVMAQYYEYFAYGQRVCNPSYIEYTDAITGTQLYAGCLPMYDRREGRADMVGVACMDVNMVGDIRATKAAPTWREEVSRMSDVSKMCRPLELTDCHLQKLRFQVSPDSVCSAGPSVTSGTQCPCVDADCSDDQAFIDELGYFCDTWIGDDCYKAGAEWGYSAAGQEEVLAKCKRSCGLCKWHATCPYTSAPECSAADAATPKSSRACLTDKVSGVDMEGCAMSCGDNSSVRFEASRACYSAVSAGSRRWSAGGTISAFVHCIYIAVAVTLLHEAT